MIHHLNIADTAHQEGQGPVMMAEFIPPSVPDLCGPVTSSKQEPCAAAALAAAVQDAQGAHPPEPTPLQVSTIPNKQDSEPSTQEHSYFKVSGHSASKDSFVIEFDSSDEPRPCPFCDGVLFRSTQERIDHFMEKEVQVKHKIISNARNRAYVKVHAAATGRKGRQKKCELCRKTIKNDHELQVHRSSKGHAAAIWASKVAIQTFSGYLLRAVSHDGMPGLPEVLNDVVLEPPGLAKELAEHCASLQLSLSAEYNKNRWSAFLRAVRTGTLGAAGFNVADDLGSMELTETDILDDYLGMEDLDDDGELYDDDADLYGEMSE
jgi:hypothetical protein